LENNLLRKELLIHAQINAAEQGKCIHGEKLPSQQKWESNSFYNLSPKEKKMTLLFLEPLLHSRFLRKQIPLKLEMFNGDRVSTSNDTSVRNAI
jgi:hypothetical protein